MSQDLDAYASLGLDVNKADDNSLENKEGVSSEKIPELTLKMSDEKITSLTQKWEKEWMESPVRNNWLKQCKENEDYWLGKQFDTPVANNKRSMVDNLIFEALETYLPQTTRRNPEPLVTISSEFKTEDPELSKVYEEYIEKVKNKLSDLSDVNKLRLKLKKVARHWAIYLIGVIKFGWDLDKDIPVIRVIRPKKLILDPKSTIDEDGYTGNRIGEYRKLTAFQIVSILGDDEKSIKIIKDKVKGNLATEITFIEWWTKEYMCWTLEKDVLFKKKNPHWNYDKNQVIESVNNYGETIQNPQLIKGINHLSVPDMPFRFLSVFNLGDQPMDKTSLIGQNLSNQDLINKRNKQIDKNTDNMNGGMVVSLARAGLTQSQAKSITTALRKGGTVIIPDGAPREAIERYPSPGLPNDVYNQLSDMRMRLKDIFGTSGSTPSGIRSEPTVRGKIINRGLDTDRIGGGVSEYLEQLSDDIYNYLVQLLYVYDEDFQFIGNAKPPKLLISVKEGSLLPKDSTSIANQALELASMGRISNIDLYKRLEYPNPEELAANVWLETNAPQLLFKDNQSVQQAMSMIQSQQQQDINSKNNQSGKVGEKPSRSNLGEVPLNKNV